MTHRRAGRPATAVVQLRMELQRTAPQMLTTRMSTSLPESSCDTGRAQATQLRRDIPAPRHSMSARPSGLHTSSRKEASRLLWYSCASAPRGAGGDTDRQLTATTIRTIAACSSSHAWMKSSFSLRALWCTSSTCSCGRNASVASARRVRARPAHCCNEHPGCNRDDKSDLPRRAERCDPSTAAAPSRRCSVDSPGTRVDVAKALN